MGCVRSVNKASPSMSHTATSPHRAGSSSSRYARTQYTGNMVTGASTADLAIILIDARTGSWNNHRHSFIASLLGIKHLVVCVNKMDLVDFDEDTYQTITSAFRNFLRGSTFRISNSFQSARLGDNVVEASVNMPWYEGGTLLSHWKKCTSAATATCKTAASPFNTSSAPKRMRRATSAGTPVGSLQGCLRWATKWWHSRAACSPASRKFSLALTPLSAPFRRRASRLR